MARDAATYRGARRNASRLTGIRAWAWDDGHSQIKHHPMRLVPVIDIRTGRQEVKRDGRKLTLIFERKRVDRTQFVHASYVLTVQAAERKRRERIGGLGPTGSG